MNSTNILEACGHWIWQSSWQTAILIGLVLLAQRLFRKQLTPAWRYNLWLLVMVRLALPVCPASPWSIFNLAHQPKPSPLISRVEPSMRNFPESKPVAEPLITASEFKPMEGLEPPRAEAKSTPPAPGLSARRMEPPTHSWLPAFRNIADVAPWIWAGIVVFFGGRLFWDYSRLRLSLEQGEVIKDDTVLKVWTESKVMIGIQRRLELMETGLIQGPALFGLVRVRVLLPKGLAEHFSVQELRHVFLHELAHLKRGDLVLNWLMTVLQVLHWFNPMIWLAMKRMRADRELACDALVLSLSSESERKTYGQTIIKLLESSLSPAPLPGLVGILEHKNEMQRRIRMIAKFKKTNRWPVFAMGLLLALGLLTLTDAQNKVTSEKPAAAGTVAATPSKSQSWVGIAERVGETGKSDPAKTGDFIDTKTGLKYVLTQTVTGESDIIENSEKLSLSANGKFMLWRGRVIPLDGNRPFQLQELHGAGDAAWSPDGTMIAFHSRGMWVLPVSPGTGWPMGPARKLAQDSADWLHGVILWSPDAEQVLFAYYDNNRGRKDQCFSAKDGKSIEAFDYARFGIRSSDGNRLAYPKPGYGGGVWSQPSVGGPARLVAGGAREMLYIPLSWSPDDQWLLCGEGSSGGAFNELRLVRLVDRYEYVIRFEQAGVNLGLSPDRKKLLFYQPNYEVRGIPKMAAVRGGRPIELPAQFPTESVSGLFCPPDGKRMVVSAFNEEGDSVFWIVPVAGRNPVKLVIDASVGGIPLPWLLSPDGTRLFFAVNRGAKEGKLRFDLYVIPVSLERGRTSGPAVLVFQGWQHPMAPFGAQPAWSRDSQKLAVPAKGGKNWELWIANAKGGQSVRIADAPEQIEQSLVWSPNGQKIACLLDSMEKRTLQIVATTGGPLESRFEVPTGRDLSYAWLPDSKGLNVISNETVWTVSIDGGIPRPMLQFADTGFDWASWLGWSPDGKSLAIYGGQQGDSGQFCLVKQSGKMIDKMPIDSPNKWFFGWVPDSQSIFYLADQPAKKGPGSRMYELTVAEAFLKAQASAPSIAKSAAPAPLSPSPANLPPQVGSQFTDIFSDGQTQYWTFEDQFKGDPAAKHRIENGELVLENTKAKFGSSEWKNYVVKVRLCIKNLGFNSLVGMSFRRSADGSYVLNLEPKQKDLWLSAGYNDSAKNFRVGAVMVRPYEVATNIWYAMRIEVNNSLIKVFIDDALAMETSDENHVQGFITLLANNARVHFDDFSVQLLP